jgi:nitric-oxide synthase
LRRHLAEATNGGRLRNRMTVFAPDGPEGPAPLRLANRQLIGYAGFRDGDRVLGDPAHVALTDRALALGWEAEPGPWRVLPWIVETAAGNAHLFPVPDELVLEVPIRHPEHPGVAGLGLRWYAVPALADLVLHLGGLDFPAAPFNGWYMVTEIAARDLADAERFDALPAVARAIGRSPEGDPYARDAALLALNEAVWHSFRADGVRIVDHHLASAQYARFAEQEEACGRTPNAEWSWLVPPMSPALAPQFHTPMAHEARDPEFRYRPGTQPPPAQRRARTEPETAGRPAADGTPPPGCPFHARAGEA